MTGIEAGIERSASDILEKQFGIRNIKIKQTGWPDRIYFVGDGVCVFIEYKRPGEEPTPLQYDILERLDEEGYWVLWTDNESDAINAVLAALSVVHKTQKIEWIG